MSYKKKKTSLSRDGEKRLIGIKELNLSVNLAGN